ncbi:MAG TPA: trypsin-like peptidase domain-containing protein [Candidatus Limnocylindria bacterium]|nr:trypsin-like peptidase domain-containing protein [Candidatus Limnocylindria bacterium]
MRVPLLPGILAASLVLPALAATDTLLLKDKAALSGKILAEKKDMVVLDVGYTVMTVPRNQIVKITRATDEEPAPQAPPTKTPAKPVPVLTPAPAENAGGLYSVASSPLPERSVRDLVSLLGEGVVQVRTPSGLGSGFFITEDGYLITNFHVIEGETKLSIEVYHMKDGQLDRRNYKDVRIVAMNKFNDLTLLKVEDKDAPKFRRVLLGDSEILSQGDHVFAIGSPLGLERTVTEGILSTTTRQMQGDLYLQTTAQINPGNSGGPLFNLRGEVVGVTNMKLTFGEGLGFAIPVEQVKYFLRHRDAFAYDNDNPSNPFRYLEPPSRLKGASNDIAPLAQ